jgi:hypothetical protein
VCVRVCVCVCVCVCIYGACTIILLLSETFVTGFFTTKQTALLMCNRNLKKQHILVSTASNWL